MRSSRFQLQSFARRWSATRPSMTSLLIACSVAFAATHWALWAVTGETAFSQAFLCHLLGVDAATVQAGRPWQFVTFTLVHAGPFHLLGSVLLLYFAGREVEPIFGTRHFLSLYFLANTCGGLAQWAVMSAGWLPRDVAFVGISAGVAAVVAAFATILPELEITVLVFFVLPLRLRAKFFGFILVAIAALLWVSRTATAIGPVAIIGGSILGWAYAKQLGFGNPLAIERYFLERRQQALRWQRMPVDQFITEEIDPVLEKVARGGMGSLTRAEKRLLQQGSSRLAGTRT